MRGAAWLLALLSLTLPVPAAAHETQSAGQVQVTFSTGAEDPLSTQGPTLLQFVLTGPGGDLPGCRCRLLLYQGTPSARVAPLLDVRLENLQRGVTRLELPKVAAGAYTVVLDGRPVNFGEFEAFRLRYTLTAP